MNWVALDHWGARDAWSNAPQCHVTDLLVVDLRSSLAYFMMPHPLPIANKLPINTLAVRQLSTNTHMHTHATHIYYYYSSYMTLIVMHGGVHPINIVNDLLVVDLWSLLVLYDAHARQLYTNKYTHTCACVCVHEYV